jgi:hypothetical protein
MDVVLWDDHGIDNLEEGDEVYVSETYIGEFKNQKYISVKDEGYVKVLEEDESYEMIKDICEDIEDRVEQDFLDERDSGQAGLGDFTPSSES